MENINLPNNINTQMAASIAPPKTESQQLEAKVQRVVKVEEPKEDALTPKNREEARFTAVKQASQAVAKNPYPISDMKFTIYRDTLGSSGELIYVTRFTSLRDGKITVVPEHTLLVESGISSGSVLKTLV